MNLFARNSILDLSYPHIMGILNVTPDSFYDGGMHNSLINSINHANKMINYGASIIDIGGESTRPGTRKKVTVEEELSRVIPVIEAISKRFEIWISVDTSKPEVMRESALVGAHIINDVCALEKAGAIEAAIETNLPICLMHNNIGNKYKFNNVDIFNNVNNFFANSIKRCELAGISKEKILLDPGFGFGKNLNQNYVLLARLSEFHRFNLPLVVGMSRKSMIGKLLNLMPNKCLNGSLGCAVIAAMQGAHIIRVHDVKETVEALNIVKATLLARKKRYYE